MYVFSMQRSTEATLTTEINAETNRSLTSIKHPAPSELAEPSSGASTRWKKHITLTLIEGERGEQN